MEQNQQQEIFTMQPTHLDKEEKALMECCESSKADITILQIIKGMSPQQMASFDYYKADNMSHFVQTQIKWIECERVLIANRPNHTGEVSEDELFEDMEKNMNGSRFRVFYVLKYPSMVTLMDNAPK